MKHRNALFLACSARRFICTKPHLALLPTPKQLQSTISITRYGKTSGASPVKNGPSQIGKNYKRYRF